MGLVVRVGAALAAVLVAAGASAGPATAAATAVRLPPPAAGFDYQIGGAFRPARDVAIVDRDRTDRPAPGRYSICYINAFQTQPGERRWWTARHPGLLLRSRSGAFLTDPNWPGEFVLDTSTAARRRAIARIIGRWISGCGRAGFDAVEPDNLDSWTRPGVRGAITRADNLSLATLLARRAHAVGLAIGQKNTVEVSRQGRRAVHFDFAIAEECQVYRECDAYRAVYGARVYEVEYTRAAFRAACADHGDRMSIILRDRDVAPKRSAAYRSARC